MGLSLVIQNSERLDPWTRQEFEQLIASLQAQLGQPTPVPKTRVQHVTLTYASDATTASQAIPQPVTLGQAEFAIVGESVDNGGGGGVTTLANQSYLDMTTTTGSTVVVKRASGKNSAAASVTGTVVVQIVDQRSGSV